MFSSIIRVAIAISGAVILSSCGGNSVAIAETRLSSPEGLFIGTDTVTLNNTGPTSVTVEGQTVASQNSGTYSQNIMIFVIETGLYYAFYFEPGQPIGWTSLAGAISGTLSISGGVASAGNSIDVDLQYQTLNGPTFAGAYNTGLNLAGSFSYPVEVAPGTYQTTTFNIPYNAAYQGIQNLNTLAGTYTGTVGTSIASEPAIFTFSTPTNQTNAGNFFGISTVTGIGTDGCTYSGTAAPLIKGDGYTTLITAGGPPCNYPYTQFSGLAYLDTATNFLYSYAPDQAQTDGLIFTGARN